jgi:hypothetical protein
MNDKLSKIYYNTEHGYGSAYDLYQQSKKRGYTYTLKEVTEWYKQQDTNQIYKHSAKKIKKYNKILAHRFTTGSFQADLMDMKKFSHSNKGNKYILNIIDIHSRYGWSVPIKQKTPDIYFHTLNK